jgi:hypothetical protein
MRTLFCLLSILTTYCFSQQLNQQDSSWKVPKYFFQGGFGAVNSKLQEATIEILGNNYKFKEDRGLALIDFRFGIRIKQWISIVPYTTFLFSKYELNTKYTKMGFPAEERINSIFLPGSAVRFEYFFLKKASLIGELSAAPIIASSAFDQMTLKGTGPSLGYLIGVRFSMLEFLLGYTRVPVKYCNTGSANWKEINIGGATLLTHIHFAFNQ